MSWNAERYDDGVWRKIDPGGHETKSAASKQAKFWKQRGWKVRVRNAEWSLKKNPGKAVRLRNFSGTITRKANGTVQIKGRAKRT